MKTPRIGAILPTAVLAILFGALFYLMVTSEMKVAEYYQKCSLNKGVAIRDAQGKLRCVSMIGNDVRIQP